MEKYRNIELQGKTAEFLKRLLHVNKIPFETSQAGDFTHFEIFCNDKDAAYIETAIDAFDKTFPAV